MRDWLNMSAGVSVSDGTPIWFSPKRAEVIFALACLLVDQCEEMVRAGGWVSVEGLQLDDLAWIECLVEEFDGVPVNDEVEGCASTGAFVRSSIDTGKHWHIYGGDSGRCFSRENVVLNSKYSDENDDIEDSIE